MKQTNDVGTCIIGNKIYYRSYRGTQGYLFTKTELERAKKRFEKLKEIAEEGY